MHNKLHVSVAALFGALGISTSAFATPSPSACPEQSGFQTSAVPSTVESIGGGNFLYEFLVCNTSEVEFDPETENRTNNVIRDWELPFFGTFDDYARDPDTGAQIFDFRGNPVLAGTDASKIINVTVPEGWSFAIEKIGEANSATGWEGVAAWQQDGDPWKAFFDGLFGGDAKNNPYNSVTHVLHFYTGFCEGGVEGGCFDNFIFEGGNLGEFSFESPFGKFNAPYQASWLELPVRTGDPDFPLAGPTNDIIEEACAQQIANNCDRPSTVPEPGSLALLGLGLGALAQSRRKRKSA